jgi:cytochrome c-type biogenesis protein CcmH
MRPLLIAAAFLAGLAPALALTPEELLKDPALEARARAISAELRCLVCQNQSIDDSEAPLARDLRSLVREQLVEGKTDAEIMAFVVERYGQFVLLKPQLSGETLLLWGSPFAVLLIAAGLLLRRRRAAGPAPEAPLTEAERQLLDKALEEPRV